MVLGWQIWKSKEIVEAEFHAIWEDKDLELHDITPKEKNIDRILFVEDEKLSYDGKQKDNIRINITNNKLVDDLIKVCEAIHRFNNKGERALLYDYDLNNVINQSQIEYRLKLQNIKNLINILLSIDGHRNSFCPCGSKIVFKNCHGKNLGDFAAQNI